MSFKLISANLQEAEEILVCFMGKCTYNSSNCQDDPWFLYPEIAIKVSLQSMALPAYVRVAVHFMMKDLSTSPQVLQIYSHYFCYLMQICFMLIGCLESAQES